MRSWTTFLIFGGILLLLMLFFLLNKVTTENNPVVRTAERFFSAMKANDVDAVSALLDTDSATLASAGGRIQSVIFAEMTIPDLPFSNHDSVTWSYLELTALSIDPQAQPQIAPDNSFATATLEGGSQIYFHRRDGQWKIFYITKAGSKT